MKRHTKKRQALAEINTNFTPLKKNDVKQQPPQLNLLKVEDLKTPLTMKKSKSLSGNECESIDCVLNLLLNSIELLKEHQSHTVKKFYKSVQTQTEPQKIPVSTNENDSFNQFENEEKKISTKQKLIQSNDSLSLSSEIIQFMIDVSHFGQKLKKIDFDI